MTNNQIEICKSFGNVKFLPGSFDKRFANGLYFMTKDTPDKQLTEKQNEWMFRILYKYRKQIPNVYIKYKENQFCNKLK